MTLRNDKIKLSESLEDKEVSGDLNVTSRNGFATNKKGRLDRDTLKENPNQESKRGARSAYIK